MSSFLVKGLAIGAAALGATLLNDTRQFAQHEAGIAEEHMVVEDYWHQTREVMGKSGSPYSTLNGIAHWMFDPRRFHFITRPWVHIKSYAGLVWDNLLPIALVTVGLSCAFPQGMKSLATNGGSLLWNTLSLSGRGIKATAKSLWTVVWGSMPSNLTQKLMAIFPSATKNPLGVLGVASGMGLGMYLLHLFKREVTGENQERVMNYHITGGDH